MSRHIPIVSVTFSSHERKRKTHWRGVVKYDRTSPAKGTGTAYVNAIINKILLKTILKVCPKNFGSQLSLLKVYERGKRNGKYIFLMRNAVKLWLSNLSRKDFSSAFLSGFLVFARCWYKRSQSFYILNNRLFVPQTASTRAVYI